MGKKSKKGVSRAGRTNRPAAGQGKTRSGRSRSQGGSVTSKDELCNLSVDDSSDLMLKTAALNTQNGAGAAATAAAAAAAKKSTSLPPKNVSVFSPVKEVVTSAVAMSPESSDVENKQVTAPALKEKVVEPEATQATKSVTVTDGVVKDVSKAAAAPAVEAVAAAAVTGAATAKDEDLWSNKLRDVVNEEPAVLDVTMDEGHADEDPAATKASALPIEDDDEDKAQSRGIVSLDEPAPGEAKNKTNECGCVIL